MVSLTIHSDCDIRDYSCQHRLPSLADQRPRSCPHCGLFSRPGEPELLLGHGSYSRQLRLGGGECVSVRIRRFKCTSCQKTTSILPSEIAPRRRYAGSVILQAVADYLLHGQSSRAVRARVAPGDEGSGAWKTLQRWKCEALIKFWSPWAAQVGLGRKAGGPIANRPGHLSRLLGLFGADSWATSMQLHEIARTLTAGRRTTEMALIELEFVHTGRGVAAGLKPVTSASEDPTRNVLPPVEGAYKRQPLQHDQQPRDPFRSEHIDREPNKSALMTARAKPSP